MCLLSCSSLDIPGVKENLLRKNNKNRLIMYKTHKISTCIKYNFTGVFLLQFFLKALHAAKVNYLEVKSKVKHVQST